MENKPDTSDEKDDRLERLREMLHQLAVSRPKPSGRFTGQEMQLKPDLSLLSSREPPPSHSGSGDTAIPTVDATLAVDESPVITKKQKTPSKIPVKTVGKSTPGKNDENMDPKSKGKKLPSTSTAPSKFHTAVGSPTPLGVRTTTSDMLITPRTTRTAAGEAVTYLHKDMSRVSGHHVVKATTKITGKATTQSKSTQ